MSNLVLTTQDMESVPSLITFIKKWVAENDSTNTNILNELDELELQCSNLFDINSSDKTKLPYNRKDYYNILQYLELQAEQLSDGEWNDFSDSDIGTVFLKLISYLADMNNYQIDKGIAELYLSTCTERASALLLCKLIGYKPRHFMSAEIDLYMGAAKNIEGNLYTIPDGTVIPKGSTFTTADGTYIYTSLKDTLYSGNYAKVHIYEGTAKSIQYKLANVSDLGRIVLPDYNIGFNTVQLSINGVEYKLVDNVSVDSGSLAFSVHCDEERNIFIQLPAFWTDVITDSTYINVSYLLSNGIDGRLGKNKITNITTLVSDYRTKMLINSSAQSTEGYNPETIDEIKVNAPIAAKTMNTIVTVKDFEDVGNLVDGISGVKALDYNDPSSGLVQPTPGPGGYVNDAYKVNIYVLPETTAYDTENLENNKYRNTIVKDRADWTWNDLQYVAEEVLNFAKTNIVGNQITLTGYGTTYSIDNTILGVDTLKNETSFLAKYVTSVPGNTTDFEYTINISGNNIIITMCTNWKDFLIGTLDKLAVFFKQEQILTDAGQTLREYIDSRRLHSLTTTFYDVGILQPSINVKIYMSSKDTQFETIVSDVKSYILDTYSRDNQMKIGVPIFASEIGANILSNFSSVRYCEVGLPDISTNKIEASKNQFIDIIPTNVSIEVISYANKE
jgi:hypothetical protein